MISIVIILYKSKEYINDCINAIAKSYSYDKISEIIVINNDVKTLYTFDNPKVAYYQMKSNIGYSKAMNYGINKTTSDYILTLNPDTIVSPNTLEVMIETYKNNKDVGAVGVKVLNGDDTFQLSSIRKFPTPYIILTKILNKIFSSIPNLYNYSNINTDLFQEVDAISGCCMMIDKKTFVQNKGFDERFFMYFEDTDLCIRLINKQKKVIYNPDTSIKHFKGGSLTLFEKRFINYKFYISMFRFIKKYYFRYVTFLFLLLFLLIIIIYLCQNIF